MTGTLSADSEGRMSFRQQARNFVHRSDVSRSDLARLAEILAHAAESRPAEDTVLEEIEAEGEAAGREVAELLRPYRGAQFYVYLLLLLTLILSELSTESAEAQEVATLPGNLPISPALAAQMLHEEQHTVDLEIIFPDESGLKEGITLALQTDVPTGVKVTVGQDRPYSSVGEGSRVMSAALIFLHEAAKEAGKEAGRAVAGGTIFALAAWFSRVLYGRARGIRVQGGPVLPIHEHRIRRRLNEFQGGDS